MATVLFADVVGFTSMAEEVDHETVARRVDDALQRVARIVEQHGGTVDKYLGDALMAVFGVPQTHDDDAARAVVAALGVCEAGGLEFSIGVNTGEVTVTNVGGGGVTVIGDTVNVAARLEKAAQPGEVLVGDLTAQLAGHRVEFTPRPALLLKGKREPVPVWEAVRVRPSDSVETGPEPPFVGREDELDYLLRLWRRCCRDRTSGLVVVNGDPGIGKTRLVLELANRVRAEGVGRIIAVHHPPYGTDMAPQAWAEFVAQLGLTGDAAVDRLLHTLAQGQMPEQFRDLDPEAVTRQVAWSVRRAYEARLAEGPVLSIFDDFHRGAPSTRAVVGNVAAALSEHASLIVIAGRAEHSEWMSALPTANRVRLEPLSSLETARLAELVAPSVDWATTSARQVLDRTHGNPLYVRELARLVADRGLDAGASVPPSLRAVVAARIDHLQPAEKSIVQLLAVVGEARKSILQSLDEGLQWSALDALAQTGLVARRADAFVLSDPLMAEVAYEGLPHTVRGNLHARIADTANDGAEQARHLDLSVGFLDTDAPDHAEQRAGVVARLGQVGTALLDSARIAEGLRVLERAVELGLRDPVPVLRLARDVANHRPSDAFPLLDLMPENLGDPNLAAERTHVLGVANMTLDPQTALRHLEAATAQWRRLNRPDREAWALANRGMALFFAGRLDEVDGPLVQALDTFRAIDNRAGIRASLAARALVRPDHPEVMDWLLESKRLAEESGDRGQQLAAVGSLAWNHVLRSRMGGEGDQTDASGYLKHMAELATELESFPMLAQAQALRSHLARMRGDLAAATAGLEKARAAAAKVGGRHAIHALVEAVDYSLRRATMPLGTARRIPPPEADPVHSMGAVIIVEADLLAEGGATALIEDDVAWHHQSPLGIAAIGLVRALSLLRHGHLSEARAAAKVLVGVAATAPGSPLDIGARAMCALSLLVLGQPDEARTMLSQPKAPEVGGLAGLLVLAANALLDEGGDAEMWTELRARARALGMPGLVDVLSLRAETSVST